MRYLLLVVLGIGGALALARRFELGTAATAVALLPSLGPAYLAWAAFRHDRAESAVVDLDAVADQLAQAVKKQWDDEAEIRRVNDPYPLPVAWRAADADLVEPWNALADLAHAWPGGPPGDPARWPADATGLAGEDAQIGEVFAQRVPTRRLVVLGEPGAGKTVLLIRLLQDLIERRSKGGLVPVLFSLASWDPSHQPLEGWLAEQLRRSHPGLRAPAPVTAPRNSQEADLAQALLDARQILPLLDGFDELPPALHALALNALNRALPAKQPLVVASRTAAYHAALTQPDAIVRLNGAAGIHLLPLTTDQIAAYLRRDAGGLQIAAADRWNSVITHLGTDAPIGQALSTPLGLFLARTIYNPRPNIHAVSGFASHPDELFNTVAFPTRAALDTHLFNAFIPAVYTPHQANPPRWPADQAHRTLVFLARHLEARRRGSPDMAWWELAYAFPLYIRHLVFGPVFGLVLGLAGGFVFGFSDGLVDGPANGLTYGFMGGLAGGLAVWLTVGIAVLLIGRDVRRSTPSTQLRRSSNSLVIGLTFGLAAGLAVWFAFRPLDWIAFELSDGSAVGLVRGLAVGLVWGLASWLMFGLTFGIAVWLNSRHVRRSTPSAQLRWSSKPLVGWLAVGVVAGLSAGVAVGFTGGLSEGGTVGLAAGLMGWLGFGLMGPDVRRSMPSTQLRWSSNSLAIGPTLGLGVGLMGWLVYGPAYGLVGALAFGLVGALVFGLAVGLTSEQPDLTTRVGPVTLLIQDRRVFLVVALAGGLTGGLMFGFSDWLAYGFPDGLVVGLAAGLAVGLVIGLGVGLKRTAWADFVVARAYLVMRHRVPWALMTFLQDAHERRGVLRQVGAVYHFRHIDLQRHLAQQPWPPSA
ncbi:NACHT domain-containing protein [Streptomyces tubercidicus]|uniref:NACHT domain-containing protein n=1 Tax=Streptomyces tubercidicus TaxID=47759 RepID=UPI0034675BBD